MSDERRIRFAKMKLVAQAKQYWTNVKKLMTLTRHEPIQTWDKIKFKLQRKYLHVSLHTAVTWSMAASNAKQSNSARVHHQV